MADADGTGRGRVSSSAMTNVATAFGPVSATASRPSRRPRRCLTPCRSGSPSTRRGSAERVDVIHIDGVGVGLGRTLYASITGSATLSEIRDAPQTPLSVPGNVAAGTVDAAATPDGRFVYAQGGAAGTVTAFRVAGDGTLTAINEVRVPGASGAEGIVAP